MNIITKFVMILALFIFNTNLVKASDDEDKFIKIFAKLTLQDGRALDRSNDSQTISVASTGLVSYAKIIAAKRGRLNLLDTKKEVYKAFDTTISKNPEKNSGWLYHFTNLLGEPILNSEVSTIDTAIFYYSFLKIAELLDDSKFKNQVEHQLSKIDVDLMLHDDYFFHGWIWINDNRFILNYRWENNDEGSILYSLFKKPFKPKKVLVDLPLFVYYYPLCFFENDAQIETLKKAVEYQKENYLFVGVTACDGPSGYQVGLPNVFSPLSVWAASKYSDIAKNELDLLPYDKMTGSFSSGGWISTDFCGIDYASCYIILFKD